MTLESPILVDAHVHGHRCFDLAELFARAAGNFGIERARRGLRPAGPDVLLLAEGAGEDFFARCRALAGRGPLADAPAWSIEATIEPVSLRAVRAGAPALTVIAGRQIAARERVELIAVGRADAPRDGRGAAETLGELRDAGAPVILPWGFGKWTLGRGRLVRSLIASADPRSTFVGDNGGRARGTPRPRLLAEAERLGFRDLPGSDPLPFPSHVRRVGSRGFLLAGALDAARPAEDLAARLGALARAPERFGVGRPLPAFVTDQVRMQARRLGRRRGSA